MLAALLRAFKRFFLSVKYNKQILIVENKAKVAETPDDLAAGRRKSLQNPAKSLHNEPAEIAVPHEKIKVLLRRFGRLVPEPGFARRKFPENQSSG